MQEEEEQESQSLGGLERVSLLKGGLQGVRLPARRLETPVPAACWCAQGNHWPLADEVGGVDLATAGGCGWGENKLRW